MAFYVSCRWVRGPVAAYKVEPEHPDHSSVQMAGLIKDSNGSSTSTDAYSHSSHGVLDVKDACKTNRQVPLSVSASCLHPQHLNTRAGC